MNGISSNRNANGFETGRRPPNRGVGGSAGAAAAMAGYRTTTPSGYAGDQRSYASTQQDDPRISTLADLQDPIQIHLLTETALSDSKAYEILSQEEVDSLKKQVQSLAQRIEQTQANLAIQTKYRDAAISMSKLYSPTRPEGKRRSLLGNRTSGGGDVAREEAEMERQASERRCEELTAELFSLEKRLMEAQRRLLEHTSAILQMTHRASSRPGRPANAPSLPMANGIPGSPESLYGYSNGRNSMGPPDDLYFEDGSGGFDAFAEGQTAQARKNPLEIPVKSPIREQTNQLREEADRLREENGRLQGKGTELKATNDALSLEADALRRENAERLKSAIGTESRLRELNARLREVIVTLNPAKLSSFKEPPSALGASSEVETLLQSQLQYLEEGLSTTKQEQASQTSRGLKDSETAVAAAAAATAASARTKERVGALNRQLREILGPIEASPTPLPDPSTSDADAELEFMEASLLKVESQLVRARQLSDTTSADKQKNEQAEAVLMGLWEIIQSGYAGIQQRKAERRKTAMGQGLAEDEDDMSGDEAFDPNEKYSLSAFSTKVQWLYAQATSLKEQKSVLKRQIKQQRELNSKSDSEKDLELKKQVDELQKTRDMLDTTERDAKDAQAKLAKALDELNTLQKASADKEASLAKTTQEQLKERGGQISALESESKTLKAQLAAVQANLENLQPQFEKANESKKAAEVASEKLTRDIRDKDDEIERLNVMVVELKTEVTIAKAELEGAYGSRAQRAAEAAALNKNSGNNEMAGQVDKLKSELASTLKEFEEMTKETLASEREKLDLEARLDDALASKASLEVEARTLREKLDTEVAKLQDQLDAEKLKVGPAGDGSSTQRAGATMLSEQFRATMKEERKKFQEELREEQARRRKLEDELRALKKAQGPGRSPLGPLSPR